MSRFLLDVNVFLALVNGQHSAHRKVSIWFDAVGMRGWATSLTTQSGLLRLLSNRALPGRALSVRAAIDVLESILKHPGHEFWPDDTGVNELLRDFRRRLTGHRQITDACLLALAIRNKGRLATLDRGIISLAHTSDEPSAIEFVGV